MSKGFWECLKWELDFRIKPKLSGIKMGFMCTPALTHENGIRLGSLRVRKTLEAWHTSVIKHVDNNSKPLPNQYSILIKQ